MKKNTEKSQDKTCPKKMDQVRFRIPGYRIEQVADYPLEPTGDLALKFFAAREDDFETFWASANSKGGGIKVAVLDSGVDDTHKALHPTIAAEQDFSSSLDGVKDTVGHGTHVAGIIAAQDKIGVAPEVSLYIGKVMQHTNDGTPASLVAGIEWATHQEKVDIINISLGSLDEPPPAVHQAIQAAVSNGIFVICAAGNGGHRLDFPARFSECIAVGALDDADRRWKSEDPGGGESAAGPELDVVARGESVVSILPGNRVGSLSGTSMAAPFVTGVLALALAKQRSLGAGNPIVDVQSLLDRFKDTCKDLPPSGRDDGFGFGKIDPEKLLNSI